MAGKMFKAMVVQQNPDNTFIRPITEKSLDDLPPGEVLIKVDYSSLNYKDALSATGHRGVTRKYPHTPGIDAAGVVEESESADFRPGDEVLVTGFDLGMNTSGGFGRYVRVPSAWVVKLPEHLSLRQSMAYGTAGFTAALSVFHLVEHKIGPDQGEILVTGATGGVGSIAVAILARAGYRVVAASGKQEARQFLSDLGAREVISRDEASDTSGKPLLKGRWAGAIDTVGGNILATAIKSTQYGGVVTCCGNVASPDLATTVYPFILRGVSLLGVDSAACPGDIRREIWRRLAGAWKVEQLERLSSERSLEQLDPEIDRILQGKLKGRIVVNLTK
jgi:acrylyl-CoA reductase (NADPH)